MTFATLVTTFGKSENQIRDLIIANHLQGLVLIGNQCGKEDVKELGQIGQASVSLYSFSSRGVSNNRNALLEKCEADIITFADDDLIFCPNYPDIVTSFFVAHPQADMVRYNVTSGNKERPVIQISGQKRVAFRDVSKYGVWGFFFKKEFLANHGLSFDNKLGPGQQLSHGEDTVFLHDCFSSKIEAYQNPLVIANTPMDSSSWYGENIENDILTDGYCYQKTRGSLAFLYGVHRYYAHKNYYPGYSLFSFLKIFKKGRLLAKKK